MEVPLTMNHAKRLSRGSRNAEPEGRSEPAGRRPETAPAETAGGLYELATRTLEGEPVDLGRFAGMVALVVNVASRCGLTKQYEELEALHKELSGRGFTVLGFPSNDFGAQEPGSAEEIRQFCSSTYGVTFPLFEKMPVSGKGKSAVYRLLARELEEPTWNFTKYLVAKDGTVLERFDPRTAPNDPELRARIEAALAP